MVEPKIEVSWDKRNDIVRVKVYGIPNKKTAKDYDAAANELLSKRAAQGLPTNRVLYDISEAGRPDQAARRIIADVAKDVAEKNPDLQVAYVGMAPLQKAVAQVIDWLAGVRNVSFFATEEEALDWLKKDKN